MIDIFYCNNTLHLNDRPLITSVSNSGGQEESECFLGHSAQCVKEVDEPYYDGSSNFETADGTIVSSTDEWHNYLKKYCPKP